MLLLSQLNLRPWVFITLFWLVSIIACRSSDREIPTPTMVRIWFRLQEDSIFRSRYARHEKAPDSEIDPFVREYGFTPSDFKNTIRKIEEKESLRRAFEESRRAYVDSLALETLKEITDLDSHRLN